MSASPLLLPTKCPNCGHTIQHQLTGDNLDGKLACVACSHSAGLVEFLDADARAKLLEELRRIAIEQFKTIPGFKPASE